MMNFQIIKKLNANSGAKSQYFEERAIVYQTISHVLNVEKSDDLFVILGQ